MLLQIIEAQHMIVGQVVLSQAPRTHRAFVSELPRIHNIALAFGAPATALAWHTVHSDVEAVVLAAMLAAHDDLSA